MRPENLIFSIVCFYEYYLLKSAVMSQLTGQCTNLCRQPRNCADLYKSGDKLSGVRTVYPYICCNNRQVSVYCDQETDGGGWTVFQRRDDLPVKESFARSWMEYELGFGDLKGEFWLGLNNIHALVSDQLMELRVDLENWEGKIVYANYSYFYIDNDTDKYRLNIGSYSGNAGDNLRYHNNMPFSTIDSDNDNFKKNCAVYYQGGWWFNACHESNLNGLYHKGMHRWYGEGIIWKDFTNYHYSLKKSVLRIKPATFVNNEL